MFSPGKQENNAKAEAMGGLPRLKVFAGGSFCWCFQLCVLHRRLLTGMSQRRPHSYSVHICIPELRKAIFHCVSKANVFYLVIYVLR